MKLSAPCIITPRLMPGVKIGDSFLSIEYGDYTPQGRMQYVIYLDTPQSEYTIDGVQSGCQKKSLQEGLSACLSFMSACAESIAYTERTGRKGENTELFSPQVAVWCYNNSDLIDLASCELEGTPDAIDEG